MSFTYDPEFAAAIAPMGEAMTNATPPASGDIEAHRAMWEPIIGGADVAQPIPDDVTTVEKYATATDGTSITMRWYSKDGATAETPGPAVVFFHGGGYIFGHIDQFGGAVSRYVSASGVPSPGVVVDLIVMLRGGWFFRSFSLPREAARLP